MPVYKVKLQPKSFTQTSPSGLSQLPSTTLFGAICWGIRAIYGKKTLEDLLDTFSLDSKFFLLTSTFPLLEKDNFTLRLFPKPKLPALEAAEIKKIAKERGKDVFELARHYKGFKKITFVSESLFNEILLGKQEKDLFLQFLDREAHKCDAWLLKESEYKEVSDMSFVPKTLPIARNKIDRLISSSTGAGEFFCDFRQIYPPNTNLFFLLTTGDIAFLKPVFSYLEDSGIGGERAVGVNHFSISLKEINLDFPTQGRKFVILSRWRVNPDELDMNRAQEFHYELLPFRAKLETGFDFKNKTIVWKCKTFYLSEGSVLIAKEKKSYYGGLWRSVKVDDTEIRDYGFAFPAFFEEG